MSEQVTAPAAEPQTSSAPAADATAASTQGTAPADNGQQQATAAASATGTEPAAVTEQTATPIDSPAAPAPKAPEQYADFTMPEGLEMNPELRDQFKQLAKELDLTQDQAQKLIDLDAKRATAQADAAKATSDGWFAQTMADKEIGGEQLTANAAIAAKAIDKLGTPELKTLLQQTGLVYHPEIVRAFYRAGKAISEDAIVTGGSGTTSKAQRDSAAALYPAQS